MPILGVKLKPGLDVEDTPTYESASYNATSFGRFKAGLFQKLGGWVSYYPFALSGIAKATHAWQDLNSNKRLAVGTTTQLAVILNGQLSNISPQTFDSDAAPNFSTILGDATVNIIDPNIDHVTTDDSVFFRTPVSVGGLILSGIYPIATITGATSYTIEARTTATATVNNGGAVPVFDTLQGSASVSVTLNSHGQVEGNIVVFQIPTTVGGVTIFGRYNVTSVTSVNVFVITANTAASSTATASMNGGNVGFTYYIAIGPAGGGAGYGLGPYGSGPYGIGGATSDNQTGTAITSTDWSLDNFGEILIACQENGPIFFWGPSSGFQNASVIDSGPFVNTGAFVSMAQQQVIAYGSSQNAWDAASQVSGVPGIGIFQDPLLIQWSDISNFEEWDATSETQAGNFRLSTGSQIIGGLATQNRNLIWTDLDLWGMAYTGQSPFFYSFNKLGANCGLIGKHACAQLGNSVFWMSRSNFFYFSGGGVQPIPCSVYDAVFQDLDLANAHKCVAGSNTDFTEVWFFYPSISGGLGYPDRYAKLNIVENSWDVGVLDRFTWIDRSVIGSPVAINANSIIYQHETGYDADTLPLTPSFTTGYFYLDESETFSIIDQIIPDMRWGTYAGSENAQVSIVVNAVETPGQDPIEYGPFLVNKQTQYVDCRIRAKQISLTLSSSDTGSFWRLGLVRFRYAPDGRR